MYQWITELYNFIDPYMTVLVPMTQQRFSGFDGKVETETTIPERHVSQEQVLVDEIRMALSRWLDIWTVLRSRVSSNEWSLMGFHKKGYNVWLISQLLVTDRRFSELIVSMEVNCPDKLKRLSALLRNDHD